ncbi:MAG: ABC transporter permease [Deltaproteobacteria bacterium]|nr:ABC transporter permease [Deltaproteobacteria bacterium]
MDLKCKRIVQSLLPVWALLVALLLGAGLILLAGASPLRAYYALFMGAFSDIYGISSTLVKTTPLIFAGLGVALAFEGGYFNVGAEGQLYLGGLGATVAGLYISGLPAFLHIAVSLVAGFLAGGIWSIIPGYLKAKHGVNEIITCIFMYFIALLLISYMVSGPLFEGGSQAAMSPEIAPSARLPILISNTDVHLGIVLSLMLVFILQFILKKTTIGFQIRAMGLNPRASHYAGMNITRGIVTLSFVSGGLAGIAGASEIMGLKHRLYDAFSPGYGLDAIVIAFLAKNNPLGVMSASLFFGALRSGAGMMQRATGVPTTAVLAIQGLVILFVAISLVLPEWRPKWFSIDRSKY